MPQKKDPSWNTLSLTGVNSILSKYGLDQKTLNQKTSAIRKDPFAVNTAHASELAGVIEAKISHNLEERISKKPTDVGKQTWHLRKTKTKSKNLERRLEFEFIDAQDSRWNQMPVASGLIKDKEKHRCIDIVEITAAKTYRFIELKVKSNTPAYAAMELFLYAVIYLHCRKHWDFVFGQKEVMQAEQIELVVAAPEATYFTESEKNLVLASAKKFVTTGINALAQTLGVKVKFTFIWMVMDIKTLKVRPL